MTLFDPAHRSESLAARTALLLLRNVDAVQEGLQHAARREGLPVLQATLLVRAQHADPEQTTVSTLSEALHLTPPTVSDSLKALVRKGLLSRQRSPEDGRRVFFHPTPIGEEIARRLKVWTAPVEDTVSRMSRSEQLCLMGTLARLLHDRVREGHQVEEPMCLNCSDFEVISWERGEFRCRARQSWLPLEGLRTDCPGHSPWRGDVRPS
jgi:DNA-binding MarR family transcriptional regulator